MKISEQELINKYLKKLTFKNKSSLNLEDDVFYDSQKKLTFSTDTFEEGIHFVKSDEPSKFTKKIFRSAISDIICKGTRPFVYFLSLSVNRRNNIWHKIFTKELTEDSKKFNLFLGGGDTIASKKLTISISVLGYSVNKPILRTGAKINDDIYVTGNLGDSNIGLQVIKKKINLGNKNYYYKQCFYKPYLPFNFSKHMYKFASSSIDISDGLVKDVKSLCKSSKCGAELHYSKLPFSKNTQKLINDAKIKSINIFSKGDDYQILFTSHKKNRKLVEKIGKLTSTKISMIGQVKRRRIVKIYNGNKIIKLFGAKTGYIHSF